VWPACGAHATRACGLPQISRRGVAAKRSADAGSALRSVRLGPLDRIGRMRQGARLIFAPVMGRLRGEPIQPVSAHAVGPCNWYSPAGAIEKCSPRFEARSARRRVAFGEARAKRSRG
jgi:hypothetical protein